MSTGALNTSSSNLITRLEPGSTYTVQFGRFPGILTIHCSHGSCILAYTRVQIVLMIKERAARGNFSLKCSILYHVYIPLQNHPAAFTNYRMSIKGMGGYEKNGAYFYCRASIITLRENALTVTEATITPILALKNKTID